MAFLYQQSTKEIIAKFKTDPEQGLEPSQVTKLRHKYGRNQLDVRHRSFLNKLLAPFTDILMIVLLVALALSVIQQAWTEVTLILIIIGADALVYYIQQFTTDRILRSLAATITQTVRVIRNGSEQNIDNTELVPGDIILLSEGERIAADGRIIEESGLLTNESMLTGESDPVAKDAHRLSGPKKIYEQTNMVFSGSFAITGTAKVVVTAIGNNTQYGHIASLASSAESVSPIQEKISKLVLKIAIVVISLSVLVVIIQLVQGIGFLDAMDLALAMIVSAVPEGLPIAIAIILSLGARRMARRKALIKELRAIESVGVVTTIATDKTGTLTENKLSLRSIWSPSLDTDKLKQFINMSAIPSSLASDPLDLAIHQYSSSKSPEPLRSYAFDNDLKISGNLFPKNLLIIKGAPETILARSRLTKREREDTEAKIKFLTSRGHKVIAIARTTLARELGELANLPKSERFVFLGLISIADSLRPEAIPSIKEALSAGIAVKMITGDHFVTAMEIGKELGLVKDASQVFDCSNLDHASDDDIEDIVKATTVFARVTPELKFKILSAMKATEVVAMTGDGVNDVPALANAHIGISMGSSTSIVQDASDIVLLDDNFRSIISAMKEGRAVLTNIRRMLLYLLSTNSGEVLSMTGALILGGHQLVLPIQILWINLVTDTLILVPIGLEPAEQYFMKSKPEPKNSPILQSSLIGRIVVIAVTMATITLSIYFISLQLFTQEQANTLAFNALIVMQWANAISVRGIHEGLFHRLRVRHPIFWCAIGAALLLHIFTLFGPLASFVQIAPVDPLALILTSAVSFVIPIIVVQLHKNFVDHK